MNTKIRTHLFAGFGAVLALLVVIVSIAAIGASRVDHAAENVVKNHAPSAAISASLMNEINSTVASLRGWILTSDDKHKFKRTRSWATIENLVSQFDRIERRLADSQEKARWLDFKQILAELRTVQQKIESTAHGPLDRPAKELLRRELVPLSESMRETIAQLVEEQHDRAPTTSGMQALKQFDEFHATFSISIFELDDYILFGEPKFVRNFRNSWTRSTKALGSLTDNHDRLALNKSVLRLLREQHSEMTTIANRIITLRNREDWHRSHYLLTTEGVPRAERLLEILGGDGLSRGMVAEQKDQLRVSLENTRSQTVALRRLLWLLLGLGLAGGLIIVLVTTRTIISPILLMTTAMSRLADDDNEIVVPYLEQNNEFGLMAQAIEVFRKRNIRLAEQEWTKSGRSKVEKIMRGAKGEVSVSDEVLDFVCQHVGATIGSIYIAEDQKLRLLATRGLRRRKKLTSAIEMGDGIIGQVASDKKLILITDVPKNYVSIESSLGESAPRAIVAMPLVARGEIVGVLELGTTQNLDDHHLDFLEEISESIGVSLASIVERQRIEKLLEISHSQAEELQTQQEELKAQNEELAEHTRALKSSEESLLEQREELAEINKNLRTKTLLLEDQKASLEGTQEELTRKAVQLELADKYKSEFLANMSHELRTPLNSMLILSELLTNNSEDNLSPDQVESAQAIYSSGRDLLELINDVLDLSKIEAGRMDIFEESLPIADIIEDLRRQFEPLAKRKGLQLIFNVDDDAPATVNTDRRKVIQILKNFLSNAFKFTDKGHVMVSFSKVDTEKISIDVTDTGSGIPPKQHKFIFDAFRQVDGSTSREHGGTGLGLTIARQLAKLVGGDVSVKSLPGKGSTFSFTIPAQRKDARSVDLAPTPHVSFEEEQMPEDDVASITANTSANEKKKLLVVATDDKFAKKLSQTSAEYGYETTIATSDRDAIDTAAALGPNAIVVQEEVDQIGGVVAKLKSERDTGDIPIQILAAATTVAPNEILRQLESASGVPLKRVLIIEDDHGNQLALRRLLDNLNLKTVVTDSAASASTLLAEQRFDSVILDLALSDGTGIQLLEELPDDVRAQLPPIIVHTARQLDAEERSRLAPFTTSFILKGNRANERLVDELRLFLHSVNESSDELPVFLQEIDVTEASIAGRKILVVDDDLRNTFALTKALNALGLKVEIADNGELALKKLHEDPLIELVLMDVMMPVMDGYKAMRKIRSQKRFSGLPIIALTAKAMPGDRQLCIDAGANDYMAKPVKIDHLTALVKRWMLRA